MALFDDDQRRILEAVGTLASGNPFLTERVEAERKALGEEFVATTAVWHVEADLDGLNPNVPRISRLVESLGDSLRERLASERRALVWFEETLLQPSAVEHVLDQAGSSRLAEPTRAVELLRRPRVGASDLVKASGAGEPRPLRCR